MTTRLPTGTVTFLFTDIENSTRLWEEHPDLVKPALIEHDRILRSAMEENDGYVFATGGDSFSAVFERAADALVAHPRSCSRVNPRRNA